MSNVDYAAMSDQELKQYWWANRHDEAAALQAPRDRLNQKPRSVITSIADSEFEAKLAREIRRQMQKRE